MSKIKYITAKYIHNLKLTTAWPALNVKRLFKSLLADYMKFAKKCNTGLNKDETNFDKLRLPFALLCDSLISACEKVMVNFSNSNKIYGAKHYVDYLKSKDKKALPQIVSSALAMLLHCNPLNIIDGKPTNLRRPGLLYSTYPNSPGLCQLLSDYILKSLIGGAFCVDSSNLKSVRHGVNRLLNFRIYDPSMEAGQLLLGIAESWSENILKSCEDDPHISKKYIRAGIERLCNKVVYGADLNPLAKIAVETTFHIFCLCQGLKPMRPRNLFTQNSLKCEFKNGYDAIINNPPWGEKICQEERDYLRNTFSFCEGNSDTYLAFVEKALSQLRLDGSFAFVLPATMISTKKAKVLRSYLASETIIDFMAIVPKQAFYDASIRSVVVMGRKGRNNRHRKFGLLVNPNQQDFDAFENIKVQEKRLTLLENKKSGNWCSLFFANNRMTSSTSTIPLKNVAIIHNGIKGFNIEILKDDKGHSFRECEYLFKNTCPFGYIPALLGRNIMQLGLSEIKYHTKIRDVYNITQKQILENKRIVLRKSIQKDGRLCAVPLKFWAVPIKGVIAIIAHNIHYQLLAAILSSEYVANWIKQKTAVFIRPSFHELGIHDVENIPIPKAAISFSKHPLKTKSTNNKTFQLCSNLIKQINIIIKLKDENCDVRSQIRRLDQMVEYLYSKK